MLIVHLTKLRPNLTLQLCSFSNDFGFYNWAFGVPGNFSTSSNEETGERLHSGKTQVQNISQFRPPSTSWNLGGVANIYIMAAREGKMAVVLKMAQVAASIWLPSDKHPILPRPFFIMKYEHCTVTHLVGRKVNVVGGTWALKVSFQCDKW